MRPDTRSPWVWLPPALSLVLLAVLAASAANRSLFVLLNQFGHPLGDTLWLHLTMLGDGAVALALVLPAIRRSPRCFWAALIAAVFATLWVQVLKQAVSVPRPLAVLAPELFFQSGPAYRAVSFPSGHAAAIFAIAGIWIMALPGRTSMRAAAAGAGSAGEPVARDGRRALADRYPVGHARRLAGRVVGPGAVRALPMENRRRRRLPRRPGAAAGGGGAAGQRPRADSGRAAVAARAGRHLPGVGRVRDVPDAAAHDLRGVERRISMDNECGGCWSASAARACSCCAS